jgi:hypothetical protein
MRKHTVRLLMKQANVVVIDISGDSNSAFIFDDVLWLTEPGLIQKIWYLGKDDRSAPEVDAALEWRTKMDTVIVQPPLSLMRSRLVTEQPLYAADWSNSGLRMSADE